MSVIPLIITVSALTFAISSGFINGYLVVTVFWTRQIERKPELALIYSRFCVDVLYNSASSMVMISMIRSYIESEIIQYNNLSFLIALPNFNLGSIRVLLVFFIILDRTLAACIPIIYHNYRSKIPLSAIIPIIFISLVLMNTGIFYLCDYYFFNDPTDCKHFGCMVYQCYHYKWIFVEEVMYLIIGSLAVILSIRIFIWNNCTKTPKNSNLIRANRLALLDVFIIFIFDLLPSFIFANFPAIINFLTTGPLIFLTKYFGFVIESLVVCMVLLSRKGKTTPSSILIT